MSISPNLLNLALWIGGILMSLAGIAWIVRCLFADRARGRRRCPSCWYDFAGLAANARCPECGRDGLTERHLACTRRRWGLACLAIIPLIAGYITWATPRVFEEKSATGFFPTTFLVLAAPTLDAKAIDNANNLRGLTFARLNRGEIKRPWRWLWRQRVKLAHTLTGTPYIEVAWEDVKSMFPPPGPLPERIWDRSPINTEEEPAQPTAEDFGSGIAHFSGLYWSTKPGDAEVVELMIGEYWLCTGPAMQIEKAHAIAKSLMHAQRDLDRGKLPPHRRFDFTDVSASTAVLERLESSIVPAWEGTITLPQLAERISLAAGCPVDLDLEPSTLTSYESALRPADNSSASVRVALGALCARADASMTWSVRDGRIVIHRRPHEAAGPRGPQFLDPRLAFFDVSDILTTGSILDAFPDTAENVTWSVTDRARVEPQRWMLNGGDHPIGAIGNFLVVEADLPTLHLIGLYFELIRKSQPNLGAVRELALAWGQLPDHEPSSSDVMTYLSGTKLNPEVIAYNLDPIVGEAIKNPAAMSEINSAYWLRSNALRGTGGVLDALSNLNVHVGPNESLPDWATLLNDSTLLVIAPAPTQAKVAQLLREFEARRLAQPAAADAPPAK
jgi:hypothetical protein